LLGEAAGQLISSSLHHIDSASSSVSASDVDEDAEGELEEEGDDAADDEEEDGGCARLTGRATDCDV